MQSTWTASTDSWTSTIHIWANQTFQDSVSVNNTLSTSSANTMAIPVDANISQLFLTELHEEDRDSPVAGILSNSLGVSAACALVLPVDIDVSGTYSSTTSNNTKFLGAAAMNSTVGTSVDNTVKFMSAAVLNQTFSSINDEDKVTLLNAALSGNYGIIAGNNLIMPSTATLNLTSGHTHRTNYPYAISTRSIHGMTASSTFLWNDITENTETWTDITKDASSWIDVTEDTSSSWTKQ